MMLPILISVSVAPVSYFFWARALLPKAASKIMAVENAANRRATKDMCFSLLKSMKVSVCYQRLFRGSYAILNTLHHVLSMSTNGHSVCAFGASRLSVQGQKRRSGDVRVTSALPLKADIHRDGRHVSNVPGGDIARLPGTRNLESNEALQY